MCEHLENTEHWVKRKYRGIWYIDNWTLKNDNKCEKICSSEWIENCWHHAHIKKLKQRIKERTEKAILLKKFNKWKN